MAQESRDRQLTPRISSPIYRTMMRKSTRNSIATSLAEVEGGEEIYIAFVLDHPSRRDRSPDSFNFADPVPALTSITPVF